jgi:hypothetical protein
VHVIDENGASTLCALSDRSMTPALSSGRTLDEGGAETCGIEGRTEENREARRALRQLIAASISGALPVGPDYVSILGTLKKASAAAFQGTGSDPL